MPPTSPAIEDYLKTVYAHTEWQPDAITPKVLAAMSERLRQHDVPHRVYPFAGGHDIPETALRGLVELM